MSAKHTPGPWIVAPYSDTDEVLSVVAGYREYSDKEGNRFKQAHWIAECDADGVSDSDTNVANAHLIAAVPDLLGIVREFVALYDGCRDMLGAPVAATLARAEAAIAKAEGKQR